MTNSSSGVTSDQLITDAVMQMEQRRTQRAAANNATMLGCFPPPTDQLVLTGEEIELIKARRQEASESRMWNAAIERAVKEIASYPWLADSSVLDKMVVIQCQRKLEGLIRTIQSLRRPLP